MSRAREQYAILPCFAQCVRREDCCTRACMAKMWRMKAATEPGWRHFRTQVEQRCHQYEAIQRLLRQPFQIWCWPSVSLLRRKATVEFSTQTIPRRDGHPLRSAHTAWRRETSHPDGTGRRQCSARCCYGYHSAWWHRRVGSGDRVVGMIHCTRVQRSISSAWRCCPAASERTHRPSCQN